MNKPIILNGDYITYPTSTLAYGNTAIHDGYCRMTEYGMLFADSAADLTYFNVLRKGYPIENYLTLAGQYDKRRFILINDQGDIIVRTLTTGPKKNSFNEIVNVHCSDMKMKIGFSENARTVDFILTGLHKGMDGPEIVDFLKEHSCIATDFKTEKVSAIVKRLKKKKLGNKHLPGAKSLFSNE
ncbi:hypothetical protein [Vibrio phage BONAISHI]|nr:hypothetical protein [Vibrio phage BONAISHI]